MLHEYKCQTRKVVNRQIKEAMRKLITISEIVEEDALLEEDLICMFNEINQIKNGLENIKTSLSYYVDIIRGQV